VLAAMHEQLDRLAYAHTSFFTSQAAEDLADDLTAHAPAGIGHVLYVSGGSEAVEAALKLGRQYFVERGEPQRRHIIARRQSYHGITLGRWRSGRAAPCVRAAAVRDPSMRRHPRPNMSFPAKAGNPVNADSAGVYWIIRLCGYDSSQVGQPSCSSNTMASVRSTGK
jgi:adenosylmethionine-8-amino-7-oxononanoate aminotransferase